MRYTYTALLVIIVLVLVNRSKAEDCATESFQTDRLIVMINDKTEQDLWDMEQAKDLSFCISPIFKSSYDIVEQAARSAAEEWMKSANVDFQLAEDLSCDNTKRAPLFKLVPTARQAKFKARAFFPSAPESKRKIQINRRFANGNEQEMKRLLLHELGHVLGFRHEHIHPEAGGDCLESGEFEPITGYDPASIMHYPTCGPKKLQNFELSENDRLGASELYPFSKQ